MLKVFIINVIEKNSALKDYALKLILMILKFRTSFRLVYELLLLFRRSNVFEDIHFHT